MNATRLVLLGAGAVGGGPGCGGTVSAAYGLAPGSDWDFGDDGGIVVDATTVDARDSGVESGSDSRGTDSASNGPNIVPGQCVLSAGVWYCGAGYGNWPQCPSNAAIQPALDGQEGGACDFDGGGCFTCEYATAGGTCGCTRGVDGGPISGSVWTCLPSGTACQL